LVRALTAKNKRRLDFALSNYRKVNCGSESVPAAPQIAPNPAKSRDNGSTLPDLRASTEKNTKDRLRENENAQNAQNKGKLSRSARVRTRSLGLGWFRRAWFWPRTPTRTNSVTLCLAKSFSIPSLGRGQNRLGMRSTGIEGESVYR